MRKGRNAMKHHVEKLTKERDRLLIEQEALRNKIMGVELSIATLLKEDGQQSLTDTSKRGNAKTILLDLLREAAGAGLNGTIAAEMAEKRGVKLARGTAASTLSRMKADKAITYDGQRYRLPEFARQPTLAIVGGKGS
jgi:hypothetical protein